MASEDVIELGSSDEEAEPAPKRVKRPNAMVHIPSKLPGLTIKTANSKKNLNPLKKLIGNSVTVTKIKPAVNSKNQNISRPISGPRPIKPAGNIAGIPAVNTLKTGNPQLQVVKKTTGVKLLQPLKLPINTVSSFANNLKIPHTQLNKVHTEINKKSKKILKNPIKIVNNLVGPQSNISKFPSTSTPLITNVVSMSKKRPISKITPRRTETLMVEGDEGSSAPSTANPVWYLRPEETTRKALEEENNEEPTGSNMIEITIEDSPVKPGKKRTDEIGAELAITIDDSPVKTASKGKALTDARAKKRKNEDYQSKKMLDYHKETETINTIEIELEPLFPHSVHVEIPPDDKTLNVENNISKNPKLDDDVIEVEESPAKIIKTNPATPKKTSQKCQLGETSSEVHAPETSTSEDFHPVYKEFIDLCLKIENSSDMKTIVDKKIKSYYKQVPSQYVESEDFIDLVQSKIFAIKSDPEKLYLYIKDVVDELNLQRKMAKACPPAKETKDKEAEKFQYGENSEFDSKRQRQIRKLEKTLKKLHRAIQKLEEQEVDFDDEEDSVYLLTERYKERMVRVHAKFCQLTNTKLPSEPRVQIDPRPGQPAGPAKRLEKWVNKKVPIGKPLPFPDFHDVLRCVREANEEDKLGWNEADIIEEARDLFTRCGKKLQRRRQENEWRLAASRIALTADPAEESEELKKKLESNLKLASTKESDIFNKFADKQNLLNLEAVEIGDKEADESPVESEDEVPEEGTSLEDKEKRKERLRRLINEKSNKKADEVSEPKEPLKDESNESQKVESKVSNETETGDKSAQDDIIESDKVTKDAEPESKGSEAETQLEKETNSVDSDVDELHLLQKLHSDEIISSNEDTSGNDSPIDISDNIHSGSEKGKLDSDVISIEDSSYSDSDAKNENDNSDRENEENVDDVLEVEMNEVSVSDVATITDNAAVENVTKTSDVDMESVLLPSSEDEGTTNKSDSPKTTNECINLNDDSISIGETVIQKKNTESTKSTSANGSEEKNKTTNECINLNDDSISIGETVIQEKVTESTKSRSANSTEEKNNLDSFENAKKESEVEKESLDVPKITNLNDTTSEITIELNKDVEMPSVGDGDTCGVNKETASNDDATKIAVELNKDVKTSSVEDDSTSDVNKEPETIENGIPMTNQKNGNSIEPNTETPGSDITEESDTNQNAMEDSTSNTLKSIERSSDIGINKSDTHSKVDESESLEFMLDEMRSDLGMDCTS